ncbi:MAG TPA: hypothetical protein EYP98_14360 [Planctomycetes bacterium]|nr:hypothetical protein [Planctomycetota bacterium]
MEAQLYLYSDQPAFDTAPCKDDGSYELCIYGEPPPLPCYTTPCIRCQQAVTVLHPVYAVGRMCDNCVSTALAAHTVFSISATTTPPSSSSDFGDSKYGEDAAAQTRLGELDHPEVTPTTQPPPTREAAPALVEGYHTRSVEPMAARASQSDRRLFDELARIFYASNAGEVAPWSTEKLTWLKVTRSRYLGWALVPLPSQMALLAERLVYIYPAGLMVFYTDTQAVHHYRTGNEAIPTSIGSAMSLVRKKLGICCLVFVQRKVGILEALTHPEQTEHGTEIRSMVEEAAAGLPRRRGRWHWQQF